MVLRHRKFAKTLFFIVLLGSITAQALIVVAKLPTFYILPWYKATFGLIIASTAPLTLMFRVIVFARPRIFASLEVFPDRMVRSFGKKKEIVLFSQIQKLKISWVQPRWLGGFTLELKSGQKFFFLSALERTHEVLDKMVALHPDIVDEKRFKEYMFLNKIVETSWERIREKLRNWHIFIFKYLIFGLVLARLAYENGHQLEGLSPLEGSLSLFINISIFLVPLAIFLNHLEEKWNNKHLKSKGSIERDRKYEKKLNTKIQLAFYAIAITGFAIWC